MPESVWGSPSVSEEKAAYFGPAGLFKYLVNLPAAAIVSKRQRQGRRSLAGTLRRVQVEIASTSCTRQPPPSVLAPIRVMLVYFLLCSLISLLQCSLAFGLETFRDQKHSQDALPVVIWHGLGDNYQVCVRL